MKTRFLLALMVLFSATLIIQSCSSENSSSASTTSNDEISSESTSPVFAKQEIAPPIQAVDVAFNNFEINNSKAQTLELENGTTIEIPANAFVDANGNPVTDKVNINYREFHDAAAILASGIPMKAFHNGREGVMQTAGMFEINANVGESEVSVAEGKNIRVNMASNVEGDNYDFWSFDKQNGNWENKGTSTPQPNAKKQKAKSELADMKKIQAPARPVKFDKKKPVLNFELNFADIPELKKMKNIFWQYTGKGEDPKKANWIFTEKWETADIKKGNRPNEYTLVLKNSKRNFSTSVCPSQSGKEFEQAMTQYEKEMKSYESSKLTMDQRKDFMQRQAEFVRSFDINSMGIYNYDILLKNPENLLFVANFDFGPDVPKGHNKVNVYLITNDGRSVIAFPYKDRKRFGINPNSDNRLVAILPNNKIASFSQQDFDDNLEEMKAAHKGEYTFKMNIQSEPIQNMDDLEKAVASVGNGSSSSNI